MVGDGRSYGAELLVEQRTGRLTGWVGYTLSWTDRQFDEVNFGERFPFRYDRRHDISVTGSYQWTKRLTASATWVFGTGQAITLPVSSYDPIEAVEAFDFRDILDEGDIEEIRGRNGFRMQPYHRLDLNVQHRKEKSGANGCGRWASTTPTTAATPSSSTAILSAMAPSNLCSTPCFRCYPLFLIHCVFSSPGLPTATVTARQTRYRLIAKGERVDLSLLNITKTLLPTHSQQVTT